MGFTRGQNLKESEFTPYALRLLKKAGLRWLKTFFWKNGQIILDEKQKSSYLHRMTSKEFGFFHESNVTAVAMTTMTFQNGGYIDFRAI